MVILIFGAQKSYIVLYKYLYYTMAQNDICIFKMTLNDTDP